MDPYDLPPSPHVGSVKRNLKFSFHESTPVLGAKSQSRKRKSLARDQRPNMQVTRKLSDVIDGNASAFGKLESGNYFSEDSFMEDKDSLVNSTLVLPAGNCSPISDDSSSYKSCMSDSYISDDLKSCASHSSAQNSPIRNKDILIRSKVHDVKKTSFKNKAHGKKMFNNNSINTSFKPKFDLSYTSDYHTYDSRDFGDSLSKSTNVNSSCLNFDANAGFKLRNTNDLFSSNIFCNSFASNGELSFDCDKMMVSSPVYKSHEDVKLSTSLEKCSLMDWDAKRVRWEESPKSNSAPGTPQHSGSSSSPGSNIKKYHSLDFTPTKSSTHVKIGSPESHQILYPSLVSHRPAFKPKSPQKLRAELKRLNKPAKKRLFTCNDFVYLFTRNSNNREIVWKIFGYLGDVDLANVVKVSKLWKSVLREDRNAYLRYRRHHTLMINSKENLAGAASRDTRENSENSFSGRAPVKTVRYATLEKENLLTPTSIVRSPAKSNWHKYTKLAANLSNNQQLTKCPMCGDPSVVERNIAQCTKHHCQYIWCVRCLSSSLKGPDHFVCNCEKGTTPEKTLFDSPKNCSFLTDNDVPRIDLSFRSKNDTNVNLYSSFNNSSVANSSSGYFSDVSDPNGSKSLRSALTDLNRNSAERKRFVERPDVSFHSVAEICMRKKSYKKVSEPSSPPKVKMELVGSEKSKKSLRRLCM